MEKLRLQIIDLCNKSGLPLEALLFVVKDVYRDVNEAFQNTLRNMNNNESQEEEQDDN